MRSGGGTFDIEGGGQVLIPSLSGNAFWRKILSAPEVKSRLNPFFIRECVLAKTGVEMALMELS